MLNYDRDALAERRRAVEEENRDVIIWGNDRVIRWAISIGLKVTQMTLLLNYCPPLPRSRIIIHLYTF